MINLYILNESNPAAVYGVGTYIRELTASLKNSRISICIVYLRSDSSKIIPVAPDGIKRIYIPPPFSQNNLNNKNNLNELYYRNVVYLLKLQIENTSEPVFHLNYNHCYPLANELKKAFKCKIISTVHYLEWCFHLYGNISRFRQILASEEIHKNDELENIITESYHKEKKLFDTVDGIICLSENTRQILQNDYQITQKKITVIYNGLSDINIRTDRKQLRQKYNIPDIPIILFAGRLDDLKGLKYALQSFKTVVEKQPCHFIIAGNGAFDTYMKECEDIWMHITWTGQITKEKLYDLYSIADLGVMPSFHEQCSYVAIEMMMHGLPMVTTSAPGLAEMTEDGISSLHVPIKESHDKIEIDAGLLAEKILCLLQHPEEAKKMGQNGRKRYLEKYSLPVFRKNMLNFYKSLYPSNDENT